MYSIFPLIWMLGATFFMDEMTMCIKGHHADKTRMTYNVEGDGLQKYDIFQKVYTYQISICNDPVSKKYLTKRLSSLDAIVMELFDTEAEKKYQCAMDNIYNSATFFKAAYNQ